MADVFNVSIAAPNGAAAPDHDPYGVAPSSLLRPMTDVPATVTADQFDCWPPSPLLTAFDSDTVSVPGTPRAVPFAVSGPVVALGSGAAAKLAPPTIRPAPTIPPTRSARVFHFMKTSPLVVQPFRKRAKRALITKWASPDASARDLHLAQFQGNLRNSVRSPGVIICHCEEVHDKAVRRGRGGRTHCR